ncbi:FAD-dependent monooxygenase [Ornithinimicrobium faecis]|uniref:FAD-dependent monooxygenase n=1 Tax=Ornithinimicrobium faecis TaxID=2934158 RepID=A0ABY4YTS5_9MICO|nr:FAD-dependent oxidoreductase [Ornithinimicrobium sp. HY1793]USQ80129.1 FAD-dependent monooxygenase [Ornithinimicrobium sp. HY1793]
MNEQHDVLIAGAGPVGLFAALRLAQQGVDVLVVEAEPTLGTVSKASTFHPSTLDLLDEAGAADELLHQGVLVDEIQWRDLDATILASIPFSLLAEHTAYPYRLHAEQTLLTPILLRQLRAINTDSVRFSSRCESLVQDSDGVSATIATADGSYTVKSPFLLAADGAHSEVRKQLGIDFPGQAYESRALRVITKEDLREHLPGLSGITYVRDARQSCSLLQMRDHWRFIFRVADKSSDAEALEPSTVRQLVDTVAPGVSISMAEVYSNRAHVASSTVLGRVALIGDSAHVTTTAGGMNMNCGLHDAYAMARATAQALDGSPLAAFEDAGDERRRVVRDVIVPRTESRAAGSDGDTDALTMAIAAAKALAEDPHRAFTFLYEASLFDTAPRLRRKR